MIDPKELRIGNIVEVDDNSESWDYLVGEILAVEEFKGSIVQLKRGCGCCYCHVEYADLSPTPLTEEWLNKLGLHEVEHGADFGLADQIIRGFKLSDHLFLQKNKLRDGSGNYDGFTLSIRSGLVFRLVMGCLPIKTVHRLQNIVFDFTGKELTLIDQHDHNNKA